MDGIIKVKSIERFADCVVHSYFSRPYRDPTIWRLLFVVVRDTLVYRITILLVLLL